MLDSIDVIPIWHSILEKHGQYSKCDNQIDAAAIELFQKAQSMQSTLSDEKIFTPSPEQSLDAFLSEQLNQKAFAVAFKEWYGRYGNITFEKNLSDEIEPIWNNAGTRERWSVKSMADIFLLGFRYGRGFKVGKLNCANCEMHVGTNYIGSILIRKGKEHYFCDSINHNLDEFYCLRKWLETKR